MLELNKYDSKVAIGVVNPNKEVQMSNWQLVLLEPARVVLSQISQFVMGALLVIFILLIGWVIAKVVSGLIQKGLDAIRFNDISAKIGLTDLLTKGNVQLSPSALLVSAVLATGTRSACGRWRWSHCSHCPSTCGWL